MMHTVKQVSEHSDGVFAIMKLMKKLMTSTKISMWLALSVLWGFYPAWAAADQQTFNYTGAPQSWVVPGGVTSVTIQATGAKGGGGNGGNGARAIGTYSVSFGQTLYIYVGGQGTASAGGFNGGGARGEGYDNNGFGGGGASDVRQGGTAPANRIIVGAGGGGQSGNNGNGGAGGAPNGANGSGSASYAGKGATITVNGAGGTGDFQNGTTGNANGIGGKGGGIQNAADGGGGGGGGYRGGGGGGDGDSSVPGGGGGGSSNVGSGTSTSYTAGVGTGNGQVIITWTANSTPPVWYSNGSYTAGAQGTLNAAATSIDVQVQPAGNNCNQAGGDGGLACRTDDDSLNAVRIYYALETSIPVDGSCSGDVDRGTALYQDFTSSPLTATSEKVTGLASDTQYCFEAALRDDAGNISSAGTAEVAGRTLQQPLGGVLAEAWSASYNGSSYNYDEASDMKVDDTGNVYVTGRSYNGNNYDFATVKYNSAGVQQWVKRYNGGSGDEAVAIALDTAGNIYVTGRSYTAGQYNYTTVKYLAANNNSGTGQEAWVATYDNAGNDDEPVAIAVDGGGNVTVTGKSGNGSDDDYATVKYSTGGGEMWVQRYDGGGADEAIALGLDSDGNAYVTGRTQSGSTDITTIRYASNDGHADWTTTYNSGNNEFAAALTVRGDGSSGKVYVTGRQRGGALDDIVTLEYDTAGGAQQWVSTYQTASYDMPAAITSDSGGNVYVTGKSGTAAAYDFVTLKYTSDGAQAWVSTYDSGNNDEAVDIGIDGSGNVVVTGWSHNGTNVDYVIISYYNTGLQGQVVTKNNGGDDTLSAMALGIDGAGKTTVHVTGASFDVSGGNYDYLTVKYTVLTVVDLTVANVSGPATATNNSTIEINNAILNVFDPPNGIGANAGPFVVGLYLAPEVSGAPDLNNLISLGTRNIPSLAVGATNADVTSVTIPPPGTVPPGNYYYIVQADSGSAITEADENNNIGVSAATVQTIDTSVLTDLVITNVAGPTSAARGDTISVSTTVENLLGGTAGAFKVGIYLSTDSTITTGDLLLGERSVAGLAGNSSDGPVSTDVTIPLGLYADSGTNVFNYTGGQQQFVVPEGVTSVTIQATGAKGGGGNGGKGAKATATYSVTAGETLYVYVGGQGTTSAGGFNGGGGIGEGYGAGENGFGGGGASDVRQGGTAPANRIIVGAGGGGQGPSTAAVSGGNGGTPNGANGGGPASYAGKGATITVNGAGGTGDFQNGTAGNANGIGGKGGGIQNAERGAGGGGGGYRGGGGGGDSDGGTPGGGGGGSSYVGSGASTSYTAGAGTGNGQVIISYSIGPQTYYLGAIADYEDTVTEYDESNNAVVQTGGGGGPESTVVSVVVDSTGSTSSSGGGAFGPLDLMMLGLSGLGIMMRRRWN